MYVLWWKPKIAVEFSWLHVQVGEKGLELNISISSALLLSYTTIAIALNFDGKTWKVF